MSTGVTLAESLYLNGLTRSYILYVPPTLPPSQKAPLLLVFHGHGETAADMVAMTGFDEIADQHNFIVVYPQGYEDSWNDGRGTTEAQLAGVNDVQFVRTLVHQLQGSLLIDPARVYAAGFSNGAIFTELLGCDLARMFAGIATVAGPIAAPVAPDCHPSRPLSVFEIQGSADAVVPYQGGMAISSVGGQVLSASATRTFWLRNDACTGPADHLVLPPAPNDGTGVTMTRFSSCADGTAVQVAMVTGGAHEWPGDLTMAQSGTSPAFHASTAIWKFFEATASTTAAAAAAA